MNKIAVVVPTIRPESMRQFKVLWDDLFKKHNVTLVQVNDGEEPIVTVTDGYKEEHPMNTLYTLKSVNEVKDVLYNLNDGIRNFGFAVIAKYYENIEVIVSLDDDTAPFNDTIQDHLDILNTKKPISWMSTASEYMRGFPYNLRQEARVVLSHGVWDGVADWDAATQLINGNRSVDFYKGVVPKGIYSPLCAMNFAFTKDMLPYVYQAPMGHKIGLDRFADIWAGIELKKDIDRLGLAYVTGYAKVRHNRASNVYDNLIKEAKGLKMNENYGEGPYFTFFKKKRDKWINFVSKYM